jgi:hypothetical protein
MESPQWKNRPNFSTLLDFFSEMKNVLVYALFLSNDLEYVWKDLIAKEKVLIWKRETLPVCLLHLKNRVNSKLMLLLYNEIKRMCPVYI